MIRVQSETLEQAWDDLQPLIFAYWKEAEAHRHYQGLDISRARYAEYERAGMLHCVTVRDEGVLVGYAIGYISDSMRSQLKTWGDDMFYLLPSHRGRTVGPRMLRFIEEYCRDHQVAEIVLNARADGDLPDILDRLDYTPVSVQYSKRLGRADSAHIAIAVIGTIHDGKTKRAENA